MAQYIISTMYGNIEVCLSYKKLVPSLNRKKSSHSKYRKLIIARYIPVIVQYYRSMLSENNLIKTNFEWNIISPARFTREMKYDEWMIHLL